MSRCPFYTSTYNGRDFSAMTASDRLLMVHHFDLQQCQAALGVRYLQTTVRQAIERRIRKLQREAGQ